MPLAPFETTVDGLVLRGTLRTPTGTGPFPTAVLCHGFGGSRGDGGRFLVDVARALADRGVATLAYDRAGHGESDGEFFGTHVTQDVAHALRVLDAVAALDVVDADDLHLAGISLGAVVASCTAAATALPVRSLTMWSTAAVFVDDIRSGQIQGMSLDTLDTLGYFDFHGQRMGRAMVDDALTFDPYARAAAYRGPALLMHGTADFVPVRYAQGYLDVLAPGTELEVVEGADHGWSTVPHRELVASRTAGFVESHVRPAAGAAAG